MVKVPVDVAIGSAIVKLPAPPKVKLYVPVIAFPEATSNEFVPASAFILVAAPKVINPAHEFVPEINLSAPSVDIPVPDKDNASAPTAAPSNCNAAVDATVTPPAVVPAAVAFCRFKTPAFTVVEPS